MKIAVVGICASGKSTLVSGLRTLGYNAYNLAQEHSCIKKLWQKRHPDILILLDADLITVQQRRRKSWTQHHIDLQHKRLSDAKINCDLYLETSNLTINDVLLQTINFIQNHKH
ncbi:hypothetical protein [Pectinatus sottacetonis]|uniref:hypothetical protein n=1 Tax=Pectinatus sottacetonis TaxID=1002795 RepID=UPI0018C52E34|nr:hypothetical protein [Pectinatus sottacetonis]